MGYEIIEINFNKEKMLHLDCVFNILGKNQCIISDYLYKERKYEEGLMTKMRASYVCEEACATYAKEMGLDEDIKVGSGVEVNQTILADVFEAFVAAVYLDHGFDFVKKFVLDIIV